MNALNTYNNNPKHCKYCNKVIPYEKRINNYCNSSCFASKNNEGKTRNKNYYNTLRAGGAFTTKKRKTPDSRPQISDGVVRQTINPSMEWLSGLLDGEGYFGLAITQRGKKRVDVTINCVISMTPGKWEYVVEYLLDHLKIKYVSSTHNHLSAITIRREHAYVLCKAIYPNAIIKKPIIRRLIDHHEYRSMRKKGTPLVKSELLKMAADIDFVRAFNRKRNTPYKWTGNKLLEVYGVK